MERLRLPRSLQISRCDRILYNGDPCAALQLKLISSIVIEQRIISSFLARQLEATEDSFAKTVAPLQTLDRRLAMILHNAKHFIKRPPTFQGELTNTRESFTENGSNGTLECALHLAYRFVILPKPIGAKLIGEPSTLGKRQASVLCARCN